MSDEQRDKASLPSLGKRVDRIGPPPPRKPFMAPPGAEITERGEEVTQRHPMPDVHSVPDTSVAPVAREREDTLAPAQRAAQLRRQTALPPEGKREDDAPHDADGENSDAPSEIPPEPTPLSWPQITHGSPMPPFERTRPDGRTPRQSSGTPESRREQRSLSAPEPSPARPSETRAGSAARAPSPQQAPESAQDFFEQQTEIRKPRNTAQSPHFTAPPGMDRWEHDPQPRPPRDADEMHSQLDQLLQARQERARNEELQRLQAPAQWPTPQAGSEGEKPAPGGCLRTFGLYIFFAIAFAVVMQFCQSL